MALEHDLERCGQPQRASDRVRVVIGVTSCCLLVRANPVPVLVEKSTAVVWFRRDLRLHDHPPLRAALEEHERVIPVFVLDDRLLHGRFSLREPRAVPARSA